MSYLKIQECADLLGIKPYSLRKMIRSGKVPYLEIGRKYLLDPDEVKQFLHEWSLQNLRSDKDPLN